MLCVLQAVQSLEISNNSLILLFLSNMQLNVLNDLAKAKRRWTEKESSTSSEEHYANLPDPTHHDVLHEH